MPSLMKDEGFPVPPELGDNMKEGLNWEYRGSSKEESGTSIDLVTNKELKRQGEVLLR